MKMNLGAILEHPGLFAVGGIWIAIHAGLLLLVGYLIKAPLFFLAVGSQANVGGAASAPIVASAFHPALAPVGVLLAVLGYALGTYAAWIWRAAHARGSGSGRALTGPGPTRPLPSHSFLALPPAPALPRSPRHQHAPSAPKRSLAPLPFSPAQPWPWPGYGPVKPSGPCGSSAAWCPPSPPGPRSRSERARRSGGRSSPRVASACAPGPARCR